MEPHAGHLAAAGTAVCWSLTSLFFAAAGRRIGSFTVNQIRLVVALLLLGGAHFVLVGSFWPTEAGRRETLLLALSGIIGLAIGDTFLFRALVVLGVKGATLMMTLWPAMAVLLAWPILGEVPAPTVVVGMAVTLSGVAIAVGSRRKHTTKAIDPRPTLTGILLGIGGALGQALGIVIAKMALVDRPHVSLSGTLIRMAAAAVVLWSIAALQLARTRSTGKPNPLAAAVRKPVALLQTAGGAFCGPFLGVWLSLLAVQLTATGIAVTIMSVVPVLVIPFMFLIYREKPRLMELVGAVLAVAGVALLFTVR